MCNNKTPTKAEDPQSTAPALFILNLDIVLTRYEADIDVTAKEWQGSTGNTGHHDLPASSL